MNSNKTNLKSKILNLKSRNGFTLIEMLIYIAIIGVALTSFITFSVSVSNSRNKTYVIQEVQANARVALTTITQKIQSAIGVNTGISTFGSDPGSLSLSMTDAGKNPTIISLDADDGILQITEGVSGPVAITTNEVKVTNLVFFDLTPAGEAPNIKIRVTIEYDNPSGDKEFEHSQELETTVSLRQ